MPELSRPLPHSELFQCRILRGEPDPDLHTDISFIHSLCLYHKIGQFKRIFVSLLPVSCYSSLSGFSISKTQAGCGDAPSGSPLPEFRWRDAMHKQLLLSLMYVCVWAAVYLRASSQAEPIPHLSTAISLAPLLSPLASFPALPILCISANRLRKIGH